MEIADRKHRAPAIYSPYFFVNALESHPLGTERLPKRPTHGSASSSTHQVSFKSALKNALRLTSTSIIHDDFGGIMRRDAPPAVSSPPAQSGTTHAASSLSVGIVVCIIIAVVIVVATLLATLWYVLRSHRATNMIQFENRTVVKAAGLENTRAGSRNFSHPAGMSEYISPMHQVHLPRGR